MLPNVKLFCRNNRLRVVGLPLAIAIAKQNNCLLTKKKLDRSIIGYDTNKKRIEELKLGFDRNNIYNKEQIKKIKNIKFVSGKDFLKNVNVFIITVPTPITEQHEPNLSHIKEASILVGELIKNRKINSINPVIIFESTVYPGQLKKLYSIIEKQ